MRVGEIGILLEYEDVGTGAVPGRRRPVLRERDECLSGNLHGARRKPVLTALEQRGLDLAAVSEAKVRSG